ncbi:MAG: protein kinase [Candidatus Riflebacteria bacterium]|nr:protein kinase [Candidatus Riflebacteria bacterium]
MVAQVPSPPRGLTDAEPFPPDCAARFAARRRVATGGFGAVFLAVQRGLGREVAIKLLLADALEEPDQVLRFDNEARITASIVHPNIIRVLDHGAEYGIPWIAYEFVAGRSLRAILARGRLSTEKAVRAATQTADALEAAHAAGALHRDVKPDNILEVEDGLYKVTDFGIAKWSGAGAVKAETGMSLGTPAYVSPEQITGEPATGLSDVYSLGVVLFELLTGELPFAHDSPIKLLEQHLRDPVPCPSHRVPTLPPALDRVVRRALAKRPGERYPSAGAMRDDLATVLDASDPIDVVPARLGRGEHSAVEPPGPIARTVAVRSRDPSRRETPRAWTVPWTRARRAPAVVGLSLALLSLIALRAWMGTGPGPVPASVEPGPSRSVAHLAPSRTGPVPAPGASTGQRSLPYTQQWRAVSIDDWMALDRGGPEAWETVERLRKVIEVPIFDRQELRRWEMEGKATDRPPAGATAREPRRSLESLRHWRRVGQWLERATAGVKPPRAPGAIAGLMDLLTRRSQALSIGSHPVGDSPELVGLAIDTVRRHPDDPLGWVILGCLLEKEGQPQEARIAYETGLDRFDPQCLHSLPGVGWLGLARAQFLRDRDRLATIWWEWMEVPEKEDLAWLVLHTAMNLSDRSAPRADLQLARRALLVARERPRYRDRARIWLRDFYNDPHGISLESERLLREVSPPARECAAAAYDSNRGRVVLFGGALGFSIDLLKFARKGDTWEWDGARWEPMSPPDQPSSRRRHAMAYDSGRHRVVLFGGSDDLALGGLSDTWEWDGKTWTERRPAAHPGGRQNHAMAYDPVRRTTVLFGGEHAGDTNDTWEWNGTTWTLRTPARAPSPRHCAALAFDEGRGRLVLYGGRTGTKPLDDLWEWDGTTWVEIPVAACRTDTQLAWMAYDARRRRMVLLDTVRPDEIREWAGSTWTSRTVSRSPSKRRDSALAYDRRRGRVVMFGGGGMTANLADTWEWDGEKWAMLNPGAYGVKR